MVILGFGAALIFFHKALAMSSEEDEADFLTDLLLSVMLLVAGKYECG